ncbi:MAG: hypothetical protein LDLANPLL_02217 [Turneriella sp.]|nr:hypothetical protein [Turneriella sp.]
MIFLTIEPEDLRLPGFDATSVWYLVYALMALTLLLLFLRWRQKKEFLRESLSNRFMQILIRRNLTSAQQKTVNNFFTGLNDDQKSEILLSQDALAHSLHNYLEKNSNIPPRDRVQIFDKLLPEMQSQIEVKNPTDLRFGELCALEAPSNTHFVTVMKTNPTQVLLSLHNGNSTPNHGEAVLYVYRPHLGEFILSGDILRANNTSAVFEHDGTVEFNSDQHLMSTFALDLQIEPWPHTDIDIDIPPVQNGTERFDIFSGTTQKFSERALVVQFASAPPDWVLKRQELWQLTLNIEPPLVCRVRISKYDTHGLYLLRPVDLQPNEKKRLFGFISAHEPVHEHI